MRNGSEGLYAVEGTAARELEGTQPYLRLVPDACETVDDEVVAYNGVDVKPVAEHPAHRADALVVGLVLCVALLVASLVADHVRAQAEWDALDSAPTTTVRVLSGDTLWTIANECAIEDVDGGTVVDWIREANHLESSCLMPGQRLLVPRR